MGQTRYRIIDTAGSELGIVALDRDDVGAGDRISPDVGPPVLVVEVYDDEDGQDGGVAATLVVDQA